MNLGSSRLRQWLGRLAPIYPGEGKVVAVCLAVNFLAVAGIMFGRNARDSLFLVYFGAQYLPYMYFANAVFLVLTSLIYTTMVDRVDRGKFLGGISLVFVLSLLASWVIVRDHPRWFFPVLYIESQVFWYFCLMQFWTFVGDLFDTRQAKRLFPLLAVGALAGMIAVGAGSKVIVHALGTENLLLVWAVLIVGATALGSIAFRRYRIVKDTPRLDEAVAHARARASEWQKIKGGLEEVGREPLLRSMAGYILFLWTVYAVVDFCFNKTMHEKYPDPTDLTTFFGHFVGVQGFLCLVIQLFFTRAVIARLGLGTTIDFHPAFLVAGTAWMSLRYGFNSVLTTKLGDATMLYTFSDSSYQLLYNPISPDQRARVRGFIEGYIRPLSLAAAGALILVGNNYLRPLHAWSGIISIGQQLSWGALVLAGVWLGFALTAKRGYIHALLKNLQGDSPALRLAAASALSKLKDAESLTLLSESLHCEDPERIVTAIRFLESFGTEGAADAVADLLAHSDAHVRATAAAALGRLGATKHVTQLLPLLADADDRVRANAVDALATTQDASLAGRLAPLTQDASTRVRINAHLAIASLRGGSPDMEWVPLVQELMQGDVASRSAATYTLSQLASSETVGLLSDLLKDSDLNIRCQAAKALRRVASTQAIPSLIEALAGPYELRHAARQALAATVSKCGAVCVNPLVGMALHSPRPEIRSELADVLGRVQDPQITPTLITMLKDPEWRVRWKVLKSFEHRARAGPLPPDARAALFQYAGGELSRFRDSLSYTHALVPRPETQPERTLALALREDRVKIEERVLNMLGILCGREQMRAVFQKLNSGDARQRADALEALDNLAPKNLGRQVLALLEPPPAPAAARVIPKEPYLNSLTQHPKPWVRACTAYYLSERPLSDGDGLLRTLLADREGVVRETALYAGWRAWGDRWRPQVEASNQSSDPALRRAAGRALAELDGQSERCLNMLLTVEKVLILKFSPLFAGLDGEELAALAGISLEKEFPAGEVIFEEGQPAHHLYIVARGKVEVFRRANGDEIPIATLGEKECFGEMAILDDEPRSASVKALDPTLVLKIDRESFRELISDRPQISFAIFKILSSRLRAKNLEVEHVAAFDSARHHI